ncbi:hypothetical protein CKA32_000532 [Geitlerinema sp. FC II]|nr:hypothetical protein CKA32_000532 [Geitlerinema sp. FC II]
MRSKLDYRESITRFKGFQPLELKPESIFRGFYTNSAKKNLFKIQFYLE